MKAPRVYLLPYPGAQRHGLSAYGAPIGVPVQGAARPSGRELALPSFARYLGLSPDRLAFAEDGNGKPFLSGLPETPVAIAHSGGLLAAYIGPVPAGLDAERIREGRNFGGIADYAFSPADREYLRDARDRADYLARFYGIWTRIEAIAKLSGRGLAALRDAAEDRDTPTRHWLVGDTYIVCLAGAAAGEVARLDTPSAPSDARVGLADDAPTVREFPLWRG